MKLQRGKYYNTNLKQKPEEILASWLSAVDNFYRQLTQICNYLSQIDLELKPIGWVGQCPISQLRDFYSTMQDELNQLLADADQFDQPTGLTNWEKLANHTQRLEQLNQQSQTLLQLAHLTAS